jgi:hypothetical protein
MDRPEFVPAEAKSDGPGRLIVTHRVKRQHHLAAILRPMALLVRVVFADVEGCKNRTAVGSKIEGKNSLRRIRRRRVTLVDPRNFPLGGEKRDTASRNKPTESQQTTRKEGAADHAE